MKMFNYKLSAHLLRKDCLPLDQYESVSFFISIFTTSRVIFIAYGEDMWKNTVKGYLLATDVSQCSSS